jgi:multicomponent Na+:H+ antiporter subunit C
VIGVLALAVAATVASGTYLALSRDMLRCIIGVSLIGIAANLVIFTVGRPAAQPPPLVPEGGHALAEAAANPLPQALVLTAIVIGFALTCFSLVLVLAVKQRTGQSDADAVRAAEPPPGPDGKPPIEGES